MPGLAGLLASAWWATQDPVFENGRGTLFLAAVSFSGALAGLAALSMRMRLEIEAGGVLAVGVRRRWCALEDVGAVTRFHCAEGALAGEWQCWVRTDGRRLLAARSDGWPLEALDRARAQAGIALLDLGEIRTSAEAAERVPAMPRAYSHPYETAAVAVAGLIAAGVLLDALV